MRNRILVVGPDIATRIRLSRLLTNAGFAVELAEDAADARRNGLGGMALAVVVANGFGPEQDDFIVELERLSGKPAIVLPTSVGPAAMSGAGASSEDQMLLQRIITALRTAPETEGVSSKLYFAGYCLDVAGHSLTDPTGRDVAVTRGEFSLLCAFAKRPGTVLSREQLLLALGARDVEHFDRSIDMMVVRLRRKIEPDAKRPTLIVTVPGVGYKFLAKVEKVKPGLTPPTETNSRTEGGGAVPAERRPIIALSVELVAGRDGGVPEDPEDLSPIIDAYRQHTATVVAAHGGVVGQWLGREAFAYFGYPSTHEDVAERAMKAGLALIESAERGGPALPAGLAVRVGMATGPVVIGPNSEIMGEALGHAASLRAIADPGSLMVTATMRQLAGGAFLYRDAGHEPKAASLDVVKVLGTRPGIGRFAARQEGRYAALIGRDEDLDLLLRRWRKARQGDGKIVVIVGEPGIGKSRLAYALLDGVASEPHARLHFFCSPRQSDNGFYPIIAQIEHAAGFAPDEPATARSAKLRALLGRVATTDEDIMLIAELLAVPSGRSSALPSLTPYARREMTFAALLRYLARISGQQPVVLLVEDLHWIDPTTRELIDRLSESIERQAILLVVTLRSGFTIPWTEHPAATVVALKRLNRQETMALIDGTAGTHAIPSDVADKIAERADGIPLFIEELTRSVLEGNASEAMVSRKLSLPATLQALLLDRLDRLGDAKRVAQAGAAIGRTFRYDLLAEIHKDDGQALHKSLNTLVQSGLVLARGTPPNATYSFKHALVQDTTYATMLRGDRHQLLMKIIDVLEGDFPHVVNAEPGTIAQYCSEAGLPVKAVQYLIRAGQQAMSRSALAESKQQLHQGLALLTALPDGVERWRYELQLQTTLATLLAASRGLNAQEAGAAYARCRSLGELLGDPTALISALTGLNNFHLSRGELDQTLEVTKDLLEIGQTIGGRPAQMVGHRAMGTCLYFMGNFAEAIRYFEKTLEFYASDRRDLITLTPFDQKASALSHLSWNLWMLGYPDQAVDASHQARAWANELRHPHSLAQVLTYAAHLNVLLHRTDVGLLEELLSLTRTHGFPLWSQAGRYFYAYALTLHGKAEDGAALAISTDAERSAAGFSIAQTCFLAMVSQIHGMLGRRDDALAFLAKALEVAHDTNERWYEAELHRLTGEWLIANRSAAEGEASLQRALSLARAQQARMWELRAATSLARLWRGQGRLSDATDLLAPIYGWFTEGFETQDLRTARELLSALRQPANN
jgi:DNA-binding response OmpR family regulator/predicted ATPase/class 3 adenylate cyclase